MAASAAQFSVVVIEPQPLYRAALESAFREHCARTEVEGFGTAREGLARIRSSPPDAVLLELHLPDLRGLSVLRSLAAEDVPTRAIVLTADHDGVLIYEALGLGAAGFLSKAAADHTIIVDAVRAALSGETVISADLHRFIAAEIRLRDSSGHVRVTAREREILALVAQGCSAREIARRLFVSESTVKTHLARVYQKLGVSDRAAAVVQAMKRGLVTAV